MDHRTGKQCSGADIKFLLAYVYYYENIYIYADTHIFSDIYTFAYNVTDINLVAAAYADKFPSGKQNIYNNANADAYIHKHAAYADSTYQNHKLKCGHAGR